MKIHPSLKKALRVCALAATITIALPHARAAEYNYTADNVSMWAYELWHEPDAAGNTITVTGVTAEEADLRAADSGARDNTATNNNTVTITDSSLKAVAGAYNTGSSSVASATNNKVSLSGSTVKHESYSEPDSGSEEVTSWVYGARTDVGDGTQNSVSISNSAIEGELAGAKVEGSGDSTGNSLTISAGTEVSSESTISTTYGGYSYSGNAADNTVIIEGASTADSYVYGGYTQNGGNATGNSVTIQDGSRVESGNDVCGGYTYNGGAVTDNSVTITNSTADFVYGGRAEEGGTASGNSVELRADATGTAYAYSATGGYSSSGNVEKNSVTIENASVYSDIKGGNSYSGNATGNSVNISNGATTDAVYGGESNYGDVSGNTVEVMNAEVSNVYGGYSSSGAATDNHVTLDNATFSAYVYGGRAGSGEDATGNTVTLSNSRTSYSGSSYIYGGYTSGTGNATGNTVTLKGEANELSKTVIYGGRSGSGGDAVTGNTLTLEGFKGTIKGIRNFDTVNFVLSAWEDGATLLTLTDGASILNNFTLNIDLTSWNAEVEAEGQMTLIAGLNADSLLKEWTFSDAGASTFSLESPFDVKLVTREDGLMDLVAFTPGYDPEGNTEAIPEPTTATLSLLALAGLAARRRRK